MNAFDTLVQSVVQNTIGKGESLWAFRPELAIAATIVAILVARMILPRWTQSAFIVP